MPLTLAEAIAEMLDEDAIRITNEMVAAEVPPLEILDACREGMATVGTRYEAGEYFLAELILAAEVLRQVSDIVKPLMTAAATGPVRGTIVLGTVAGDIHDIGKDIVRFMLDVNGFTVIDLGVDVPVATFVEAVRTARPVIVALSGFLTLAFDSMRDTVAALADAGLRDDLKIMIGGGAVDDRIRAFAGADAFGADAMAAVSLAKQWTGAA